MPYQTVYQGTSLKELMISLAVSGGDDCRNQPVLLSGHNHQNRTAQERLLPPVAAERD